MRGLFQFHVFLNARTLSYITSCIVRKQEKGKTSFEPNGLIIVAEDSQDETDCTTQNKA